MNRFIIIPETIDADDFNLTADGSLIWEGTPFDQMNYCLDYFYEYHQHGALFCSEEQQAVQLIHNIGRLLTWTR